jgi:cbb3-type cytochrome oxidase subunit 3
VSFNPALLMASVAADALWSALSFVLWIAVMVWIYNLAKRKGRHAVGWVILAFFFFFLALILLLILPSKRTTEGMETY